MTKKKTFWMRPILGDGPPRPGKTRFSRSWQLILSPSWEAVYHSDESWSWWYWWFWWWFRKRENFQSGDEMAVYQHRTVVLGGCNSNSNDDDHHWDWLLVMMMMLTTTWPGASEVRMCVVEDWGWSEVDWKGSNPWDFDLLRSNGHVAISCLTNFSKMDT